MERIVPQLGYNNEALRKTLAGDSIRMPDGSVAYKVDSERIDKFFTALSFGIVYKSCGEQLPAEYRTKHVDHNFKIEAESPQEIMLREAVLSFYSGAPMTVMDFGCVKALNAAVYSVKVFGVSGFVSSITIIHDFFGVFRVTSMLTKLFDFTG